MADPPPYTPAAYLVAASPLTAPQLVSQFQDFRDSLRFISTAPELVFERLAANLGEAFTASFEIERQQHAQTLHDQRIIQLSNDQLKKELAELKVMVLVQEDQKRERDLETIHGSGYPPAAGDQQPKKNISMAVVKTNTRQIPIIGTFKTGGLAPGSHEAKTSLSFATPYSVPPKTLTGLSLMDFRCSTNPRIKSYTSNVKEDGFTIHAGSWGDSVVFDIGYTWMGIEANDPDFQFGSYDTLNDPKKYRPLSHNERKITFQKPYRIPPQVVVWLSGFEMNCGKGWRVKSYATNVTTTGFTIHIDAWADVALVSGHASWVAYPSDKKGVFSGCFSTLDIRSIHYPQLKNSGYETFGDDVFVDPPRVFVAVNSFDISSEKNLRLSVKASSISHLGMTWHLDSWLDTIIHSAGASYIAIG